MKSKAFLHCSPRKDLRDRFCSGYVFVRSGGVWSEQQKLVAADAASGDQFGSQRDLLEEPLGPDEP